jgi:hypothetical protein
VHPHLDPPGQGGIRRPLQAVPQGGMTDQPDDQQRLGIEAK